MIKIWQRYFLKEIAKVSLLCLMGFFFLYFLIDYSSRGSHLISQSPLPSLIYYYLLVFLKNIDILLPFALLLATIKTLCSLNIHNELIALMASGIRLKTLLRPFLAAGLLGVIFMYCNYEFILPNTLLHTRKIENLYSRPPSRHKPLIQDITLADGSVVVYQSYDASKDRFFDVFWIRSFNDIYRIKYLYPYKECPLACFVDHLQRNANDEWAAAESFDSKPMPELIFDEKRLYDALLSVRELSISQLAERMGTATKPYSDKAAQAISWGYKRALMPWFCLLAVIAPAPFCLVFTRQLRMFMIYMTLMLTMVCFHLVVNAAMVVAQAQIIPPLIAIGGPFLLFFSFFGWKYVRL